MSKATYIGRRIHGDKIAQAFLVGKEEIYFTKVKFCEIGQDYKVKKIKDGYNIQVVPDKVTSDYVAPKEETLDLWRAEDQLAEDFMRRKRDALKSNEISAVKQAADLLRPLCRKLSHRKRNQLVEMIVDGIDRELYEAATRRMNLNLNKAIKRAHKREMAAAKKGKELEAKAGK